MACPMLPSRVCSQDRGTLTLASWTVRLAPFKQWQSNKWTAYVSCTFVWVFSVTRGRSNLQIMAVLDTKASHACFQCILGLIWKHLVLETDLLDLCLLMKWGENGAPPVIFLWILGFSHDYFTCFIFFQGCFNLGHFYKGITQVLCFFNAHDLTYCLFHQK